MMLCWNCAAWVCLMANSECVPTGNTFRNLLNPQTIVRSTFPFLVSIICKIMFQSNRSSLDGEWKCSVDCVLIPCNQGSYDKWNIKGLGWKWPITSEKENFHKNHSKLQNQITRNYLPSYSFADSKLRSNISCNTIVFERDGHRRAAGPNKDQKKKISYMFRKVDLAGIHFTTYTASWTNSIALRFNFDLKPMYWCMLDKRLIS